MDHTIDNDIVPLIILAAIFICLIASIGVYLGY